MPEARFCPSCGADIPPGSLACPKCAGALAPASNVAEHVRLLSIFHYVLAALTALLSCFPLIHVAVGLAMIFGDGFGPRGQGGPPPAMFGWLFVIMGALFVVAGWTLAIVMAIAGRALARHRRHTFCIVVAALSCLFMPFGTILGVFTIMTLLRPEAKRLFGVPA